MVKNSSTPCGKVYIVATPIGNLKDISQRAIETLQHCDLVAAEDTRHSKPLLSHLGIDTPLTSLHAFNENEKCASLLEKVTQGLNVAIISDAGTPLISDPGYPLVKLARDNNIEVIPIPGCCALITALSASGIPCQQFFFAGFLPPKLAQRRSALKQYKSMHQTLVIYESTHRLYDCLIDIEHVYGNEYSLSLAKELTKSYERFIAGNVSEIIAWLESDKGHYKGEFVLMLPAVTDDEAILLEEQRVLSVLLQDLPLKQAVKLTCKITGGNKNTLYQQALMLKPEK